jgi:hypothetical protein
MKALQRLMAVAGAADVEAAKKKLLADISRAMTMTQTSVSKGDATAKQYQATLQKLRAAVGECRTVSQVQKVRDELNAAQASRRSTAAKRTSYMIKTPFVLDVSDTIRKKTLNIRANDVIVAEPHGHHPSTGNRYRVWLWDPMQQGVPIYTYVIPQAVMDVIIQHSK